MKNFTSVKDIPDLKKAIEIAFDVKKNKFAYQHLGKNKTMVLIFFNSEFAYPVEHPKGSHEYGDEYHGNECK